jgi:cation diffusion facilitator CzcD-associated flavoprotein CzcO
LIESEEGHISRLSARFLYLGSGYYDYDSPHEANLPGRANFTGTIVHPQFWPADLDYTGKQVVVIGSGATAVTMVPAMADRAAHVTMLQRTPTWYIARPARDGLANALRKVLPARIAYALTRYKNVRLQNLLYKRSRSAPGKVAQFLTGQMKQALGDKYDAKAFTPPYNPWEQRLCLVPDGDFFAAIRSGKAEVVTDRIERFDAASIVLESGRHLPADVIVTATGLRVAVAGKIAISMDGVPVDFTDHYYYRACMFSNIPNLAVVFGYLNASWTLRADLNAAYICRLLNRMKATGADTATPVLPEGQELGDDNVYDFSSGYLQRAMHLMPRSAAALPWRLNQDYLEDKAYLKSAPIEDGIMQLATA